MLRILIYFLFTLVSSFCFGQKESSHILVSSGKTIIDDEINLDWIVGENIISHDVLFNQLTTEKSPKLLNIAGFKVYPTITTDRVRVVSRIELQNDLYIEIYDLSQRLLMSISWETNPQNMDFGAFSPGLYLIKIIDKNSGTMAVFKVIKK